MTIAELMQLARDKLTPEDIARRRQAVDDYMKAKYLEEVERHRCRDCGVDTLNYSHTFQCPWRGVF